MAAFKQHILFSSVLGTGYAVALGKCNVQWPHAALAGVLCGVSGMLPDLDSASGRPVHEVFGVTAAVIPLLALERLQHAGLSTESKILSIACLYLAIRFGAAWVFKHLTVHRGMFHSLPAAAIAGEAVLILHITPDPWTAWMLAGGVTLGFLSHLVLDEIYSVDASGIAVRFKGSAGSALKLYSSSVPATIAAWCFLAALTYAIAVQYRYMKPVHIPQQYVPSWVAQRLASSGPVHAAE
jgi:membrane-bound metal-dependent hydrolase YbcI (DUF457 family)